MNCRILRSHRKTISLRICSDGTLEVRCPYLMTDRQVQDFVDSKQKWIEKHRPVSVVEKMSMEEVNALADRALVVIPDRVRYFAPLVGVTWGRITIRNQKTRWGSCSTGGNLNFNCLLLLTPPEVLDYVVVHELCHRKEMNHSARFWAEVSRICPNYQQHRKWLKQNGHTLIARLP